MKNFILHKANSRGYANHGWLKSYHSFSFANYYNLERMNFGTLRVLNDDDVAKGMGFGTHPHKNMEIITIPLEGDLEHKDSMDNSTVIKKGEIQVMSAGTGIYHSEYNKNTDKSVKFLQIWITPNKLDITPRYQQQVLKTEYYKNQFQQILSPNSDDDGVWIYQNAWFSLGIFEKNISINYQIKVPENGVYLFLISGTAEVNKQVLENRDGLGIWNSTNIEILITSENTEILLMEIPMK